MKILKALLLIVFSSCCILSHASLFKLKADKINKMSFTKPPAVKIRPVVRPAMTKRIGGYSAVQQSQPFYKQQDSYTRINAPQVAALKQPFSIRAFSTQKSPVLATEQLSKRDWRTTKEPQITPLQMWSQKFMNYIGFKDPVKEEYERKLGQEKNLQYKSFTTLLDFFSEGLFFDKLDADLLNMPIYLPSTINEQDLNSLQRLLNVAPLKSHELSEIKKILASTAAHMATDPTFLSTNVTFLQLATLYKPELIKQLLENGADPNFFPNDFKVDIRLVAVPSMQPIWLAARTYRETAFETLLQDPRTDLDSKPPATYQTLEEDIAQVRKRYIEQGYGASYHLHKSRGEQLKHEHLKLQSLNSMERALKAELSKRAAMQRSMSELD